MENLKLLFKLYLRPVSAMSEIMDKGSWAWAAILFLIVSAIFYFTVNPKIVQSYAVSQFDYYASFSMSGNSRLSPYELEEAEHLANLDIEKEITRENRPFPVIGKNILWFFTFDGWFFTILISFICFYIPVTILLATIFGHLGNFGVVFSRDYSVLSTCGMLAWCAAHLPFAIAGILFNSANLDGQIYLAFWFASGLLFAVLMVFALRVVFGLSYAAAIITIATSWIGFSLGLYVFKFISPFLFSPFLLIMAYFYFGGALAGGARGLGSAFRQRQDFKRYLHSSTINPRDADAHVQLGLIYNQRRQSDKALEHFLKAVEIDKTELDGNFELGKIYRQKGDYQSALNHFSVVLEQNDKHSLSEIWREIGANYMDAKMFPEAQTALATFIERRPYDPEGLYYYGKVLKELGETEKAKEQFKEAIEATKNAPRFRRYELRKWSKLAEKEI